MSVFDLQYHRINAWQDLDSECKTSDPDLVRMLELSKKLVDIERFWAYPGLGLMDGIADALHLGDVSIAAPLISKGLTGIQCGGESLSFLGKPYFEVLVVHPMGDDEGGFRSLWLDSVSDADDFCYKLVFVNYADEAIVAILANPAIQAVVLMPGIEWATPSGSPWVRQAMVLLREDSVRQNNAQETSFRLGNALRYLRPELDQYLISDTLDIQTIQTSLLAGIHRRFLAPFFQALQAYTAEPKVVFHALPISRGASVFKSPWMQDMLQFYGPNIFLAETSSTQGGLDSLLDPKGSLKEAQAQAARAFGSQHSYFVTNGTSTANKIIMQATIAPGDIVLVSSDAHKSIPHGLMLTGAVPVFLEPYTLDELDLFGAVPLSHIKTILLELRDRGQLDRVKQISLTHSTFDGILYHVERVMMELLAIKPDIIFHWDEAWFAFAQFNPLYRGRTAMSVAQLLSARFQDPTYHQFYQNWAKDFYKRAEKRPQLWVEERLYPDPTVSKVRVYSAQSTHKSLSSFRQGSMIHVHDELFNDLHFMEAYRIHTSTSPNYQILASLDVARRQASIEGYSQVKHALYLASYLRTRLRESIELSLFFKLVEDSDLLQSCSWEVFEKDSKWDTFSAMALGWQDQEFVVDPTRVTLDIRGMDMEGSQFRDLLMTHHHIQINKTSRHTVLFIINIGLTQADIERLIEALYDLAERHKLGRLFLESVMQQVMIPMPKNRRFYPGFRSVELEESQPMTLRDSYYEACHDDWVMYTEISVLIEAVLSGEDWVSAAFVTPYPPGIPILVPGQMVTFDVLAYLQSVQNKEIHGYIPEEGLKVFKATYLSQRC